MRSWLEAGYLPASTLVAASYYGEVPEQMWKLSELWADPGSEAFPGDAAPAVELPPDPFIESARHVGKKEGYIYRIGHYGLGYYLDEPPVPTVTFESLEAEKEERKRRIEELNKNQPNTKHSIHTY